LQMYIYQDKEYNLQQLKKKKQKTRNMKTMS